jgi:oxygen-dependent protoporphyrinogen oxidase
MIGGARAADYAMQEREKLIDCVRGELADIMGIDATPDFVKCYRHDKSIPQYNLGHRQRLETIERLLQQHPNLVLTGNAYKGVALNDCVANAYQIAEALTQS